MEHNGVKVLLAVLSSTLVATFISRILRRKDEPPLYPYLVPWLGHGYSLISDTQGLFKGARAHFGSLAAFSLHVAGNRLYILSDPADAKAALRMTQTLTWAENVHGILVQAFGISRDGGDIMLHRDVPGAGIILQTNGQFYHHLLMQAQELDIVSGAILRELGARIQPQLFESRVIPLWGWASKLMFDAVTVALFGAGFMERHPRLFEDHATFDDGLYQLAYGFPSFRTKGVRAARERLVAAFLDELRDGDRLQSEAMDVVWKSDARLVDAGLSLDDRARSMTAFFSALHTNSMKTSCYLLQLFFADSTPSTIRDEIGREIDACFSDSSVPDLPSLALLTEACPRLNTAVDEMLRLCSSSTSARLVSRDTKFLGKTLYAGAHVLMPSFHLHRSEEIWGQHPEAFSLEREQWHKGNAQQEGVWRPFGGGNSYCPGRLLARREMLALVALVWRRMRNVRVIPEHSGPDLQKISLGIMTPAPGYEHVRLVFDIV